MTRTDPQIVAVLEIDWQGRVLKCGHDASATYRARPVGRGAATAGLVAP